MACVVYETNLFYCMYLLMAKKIVHGLSLIYQIIVVQRLYFECTCFYTYRNLAYQTRVQLAVLDYNLHLCRDKAKNKDGVQIYYRKFHKQTKKWDTSVRVYCTFLN